MAEIVIHVWQIWIIMLFNCSFFKAWLKWMVHHWSGDVVKFLNTQNTSRNADAWLTWNLRCDQDESGLCKQACVEMWAVQ